MHTKACESLEPQKDAWLQEVCESTCGLHSLSVGVEFTEQAYRSGNMVSTGTHAASSASRESNSAPYSALVAQHQQEARR
jgi:hypothetical protein